MRASQALDLGLAVVFVLLIFTATLLAAQSQAFEARLSEDSTAPLIVVVDPAKGRYTYDGQSQNKAEVLRKLQADCARDPIPGLYLQFVPGTLLEEATEVRDRFRRDPKIVCPVGL